MPKPKVVRVSLLDHGESIVELFTLGQQTFAVGHSGVVYQMLYSTDEDGGHGVLTLVPVKVEVVVPQHIDARV